MATFPLSIITPAGEVFSRPVESLIAPGEHGYLGVLAHHAPMIAALRIGVLTIRTGHEFQYYSVGEGVLEVSPEEVLVLADEAVPAETEEDAKRKAHERAAAE